MLVTCFYSLLDRIHLIFSEIAIKVIFLYLLLKDKNKIGTKNQVSKSDYDH